MVRHHLDAPMQQVLDCYRERARAGSAFAGDLPIHILLTKADKLKRGQASTALLQVKKEVGERASVQLFSALKRDGEAEARDTLEAFLGQ